MTSLQNVQPALTREQLEAHWMPYTGNRQFKDDPRMIVGAEGAYFVDDKGRRILDGVLDGSRGWRRVSAGLRRGPSEHARGHHTAAST